MAKFYVTVYNTEKPDFEIDRYLTNQMKVKSEKDIKPTHQFQCETWEQANWLYLQLRENNNVIAKFEGSSLLIVTNKN